MDTFTTLITFNYPSEAYVMRSLLESEGIECFLKDELNVQIYSLGSTALGGVKLQIRTPDFEHAIEVLKANGYDNMNVKSASPFESVKGNSPSMKKTDLIYRFLIIAVILIISIIIISYVIIMIQFE